MERSHLLLLQPPMIRPVHIPVTGTAIGGSFTIDTPGSGHPPFSLNTTVGESAVSFARRYQKFYDQANTENSRGWLVTPLGPAEVISYARPDGPPNVVALLGEFHEYATAGTETGLGIPKPVTSLSALHDVGGSRVTLHWTNPKQRHEYIFVSSTSEGSFPADTTSVTIDLGQYSYRSGRSMFYVTCFVGQTPSCVGIINVSSNAQEELTPFPFYNGIMPNWSAWSTVADPRLTSFEQGVRSNNLAFKTARTPDEKAYYQIVKTVDSGVQAGIWRQFLGLTSEHKYRVSVRLNTLAMDKSTNDWSLSFHVAANSPNGGELSVDHLAGKSPLPDGKIGTEAGQIVRYGFGHTTQGSWVKNTAEISLPKGVETITTWLRHSGKDSTGVGMDWIKVEDLGAVVKIDKSAK